MESVQHAETSPRRGSQAMSETDITTHDAGHTTRPSALGDLRFAGTIATGLVAGTLGLGAIAAPLVGWRDWPSGLTPQDQPTTVQLAKPAAERAANVGRSSGRLPGMGTAPGGASALAALGGSALNGGAAGTAGTATGGLGALALTPSSVAGSGSRGAAAKGTTEVGTSGASSTGTVSTTGTVSFSAPSTADSDHDGLPDAYEAANGL